MPKIIGFIGGAAVAALGFAGAYVLIYAVTAAGVPGEKCQALVAAYNGITFAVVAAFVGITGAIVGESIMLQGVLSLVPEKSAVEKVAAIYCARILGGACAGAVMVVSVWGMANSQYRLIAIAVFAAGICGAIFSTIVQRREALSWCRREQEKQEGIQ